MANPEYEEIKKRMEMLKQQKEQLEEFLSSKIEERLEKERERFRKMKLDSNDQRAINALNQFRNQTLMLFGKDDIDFLEAAIRDCQSQLYEMEGRGAA